MGLDRKDLEYWKNNAEEDYLRTPISVLKYITALEKYADRDLLDALKLCVGELYLIYGDKANALESSNALRISEKAIEKSLK